MTNSIYLDHAAATPVDPRVFEVMKPYYSDKFYNPSATYLAAKSVSKEIEEARAGIAQHLGCKPSEIIFTAGGTEANNLAINGIMQKYHKANMIVSSIEHDSVIKPADQYKHKFIGVNQDGIVDVAQLEKLIDDDTVLVSIMYANNEIGTVQPISQIAKIIEEIRARRKSMGNQIPIYFHSDGCQTPAYLDLHVSGLKVDLLTLNSGKIYGPKQFGCLYVNRKIDLDAQILGGGQERGIRSGTESPANIVGFAKALDLVQQKRLSESARLKEIQVDFIDQLTTKVPGLVVNGSQSKRLPNNVHITIPGKDNELILMQLDERGIQCASGSACNASNDDVSHTLMALGLSEKSARSSLRFSMGNSTTQKDIYHVVQTLVEILE